MSIIQSYLTKRYQSNCQYLLQIRTTSILDCVVHASTLHVSVCHTTISIGAAHVQLGASCVAQLRYEIPWHLTLYINIYMNIQNVRLFINWHQVASSALGNHTTTLRPTVVILKDTGNIGMCLTQQNTKICISYIYILENVFIGIYKHHIVTRVCHINPSLCTTLCFGVNSKENNKV